MHHLEGRHEEALAVCSQILERQPEHLDTLVLSAEIAAGSGDAESALRLYRRILDLKPDHAQAHYKCGNLHKSLNQVDEAIASYGAAIALDPGHAYAYCNRGVVLQGLRRWNSALESYDSALALAPDDAMTHYNRAGVLRELGRLEEAVGSYRHAVASRPDYFEAHCNCGFVLIELERWDEALASHTKSIEINPLYSATHFGRGMVLHEKKEWEAALVSYDRAIALDPKHAEARFHRGALLMDMRRWSAARLSLESAIALKPEFAEAYYSMGALYTAVGQSDAALSNFDKAIALKPEYAQAHLSRATLLVEMKQFLPAIESFDRGIALNGDPRFVRGSRCFAKMNICDWSEYQSEVTRLATGIEAGEMVVPPHQALVLLDSADLHQKAAAIWVQQLYPSKTGRGTPARSRRPEKIRVGYFSGEFYPHPVSYLMAGVYEAHDRSQFEAIGFSYGAHSQDDFGMRLQRGLDRFIDVREKSDREVAALTAEMEIDIAVDLAGHTGRGRTGIFAWRAAPIQVNYLGYAGTMAAEYMDYIIADETVVPVGLERCYAEKIVRLPGSFLPYDRSQEIAPTLFSRQALGLPATGFVFCCFNNSYKITPEVFDGWMRILSRVPNSVLWLSKSNEIAMDNLRRESARRGVDAARLMFATHVSSRAEYLARQRAADLFLDTRPYNAHATAIDALWAGLPVLTLPGSGFAARVAASLLRTLNLPELVASSASDYEDRAVQLAENAPLLAAIKEKLARGPVDSAVFDTSRYVRHLEGAYAKMLDRLHAGLVPDHIHLPH